jgi:apolipoprotein N-acyltransferase
MEDIDKLIKKLIKYSEPKKEQKTIFLWPEGVFTGYNLNEVQVFKDLFKKNFSKNHTIIFGINTTEKDSNEYFNSLIGVDNNFEIIYKYNKKKLVPFGEFLPFENFLGKLGLKKITHGITSFSKGSFQKNIIFDSFNILPLICYEIIFTELIQDMNDKTNLIINISEDAWFGGSIGPHQHFAKAIFRAVESNKYLARSANQGVSAFINNNGQIIKSLKPNEAGNIELIVPLINNKLRNKNDLIFFILLITYMTIFFTIKKFNDDKK